MYAATREELEEERQYYHRISKIAIGILRHYYRPEDVGMTAAGYVRTATLAMNERYMRNWTCGQLMEDRVDREKDLDPLHGMGKYEHSEDRRQDAFPHIHRE